jgi:hypothetical protein
MTLTPTITFIREFPASLIPQVLLKGLIITNLEASYDLGNSLTFADLNGNGRSELAIGKQMTTVNDLVNAGQVIVIACKQVRSSSVVSLNCTIEFTINGNTPNGRIGSSLDTANVNGDGFPDLLIAGASGTCTTTTVSVVLGNSTHQSAYNLNYLTPTTGTVLNDFRSKSNCSGFDVRYADDIYRVGADNLAIAMPYQNAGAGEIGIVAVQHALGVIAPLRLPSANTKNGGTLSGSIPNFHIGISFSSLGDFNGDGRRGDMIIGAPYASAFGIPNAGLFWVLFNQPVGLPNPSAVTGANGFAGSSSASRNGSLVGYAVSSAGDMTGKGINGALIGAPGMNNGAGQLIIKIGERKSAFPNPLNTAALNGESGAVANGIIPGGRLGSAVALIGDFNGDGFDDVAASAPDATLGSLLKAGVLYIFWGAETLPAIIDLSDTKRVLAVTGQTANARLAYVIHRTMGDINGDQLPELAFGAFKTNEDRSISGQVYLLVAQRNIPARPPEQNTGNGLDITKLVGSAIGSLCGSIILTVGVFFLKRGLQALRNKYKARKAQRERLTTDPTPNPAPQPTPPPDTKELSIPAHALAFIGTGSSNLALPTIEGNPTSTEFNRANSTDESNDHALVSELIRELLNNAVVLDSIITLLERAAGVTKCENTAPSYDQLDHKLQTLLSSDSVRTVTSFNLSANDTQFLENTADRYAEQLLGGEIAVN